MPIWGKLRSLSEQFLELKTCVVASTYCNSWIFNQLDSDNPYESMAKAYTELFIVRSDKIKEDYIASMCDDFSTNGILFHDAKLEFRHFSNRNGTVVRT